MNNRNRTLITSWRTDLKIVHPCRLHSEIHVQQGCRALHPCIQCTRNATRNACLLLYCNHCSLLQALGDRSILVSVQNEQDRVIIDNTVLVWYTIDLLCIVNLWGILVPSQLLAELSAPLSHRLSFLYYYTVHHWRHIRRHFRAAQWNFVLRARCCWCVLWFYQATFHYYFDHERQLLQKNNRQQPTCNLWPRWIP